MRTFSIAALCLVAACANAINLGDIRTCVEKEVQNQMKLVREDVKSRLEKISQSGNAAAKQAQTEFERKAEELQQAMTQPIEKARAEFDNCVQRAGGFFDRARCAVNTGSDLVTKVMPLISEKASEFSGALNNIAVQFRDENEGNIGDLRQQARQVAKNLVTAVKDCATQ